MFDLIIAGGTVVTASDRTICDVAIRRGKVAQLGVGLGAAARTIDAAGKLVLPGGVDSHCHIAQYGSAPAPPPPPEATAPRPPSTATGAPSPTPPAPPPLALRPNSAVWGIATALLVVAVGPLNKCMALSAKNAGGPADSDCDH